MLINIGTFINRIDKRNIENKVDKVLGLNINKDFMPTVANIQNVDISKYKLVEPDTFVFSGMQTGRDNTIRIGLNDSLETFVVSPAYTTFVVNEDIILPKYFYMIFLSPERDRLGSFLSDSSVRANLDWDRFCEIEFEIPSLEIQQKYVDVYKALVANQKSYENGLDDLKNVCDIFLEKEKKKSKVKIDSLIIETNEKNSDLQSTDESGVSIGKTFFKTKAGASDLSNQKLVHFNEFAFNSNTSRNSDTLSIALNLNRSRIVSNTYVTFKCDTDLIIPQYLFLWFKRLEFDRYARFNSWGSARETISIKELKDYHISLPHMKVQKAIVSILNLYETRKKINEKLKQQIKEICPVLIKGAIQESKGVI